jgi:hypothetical protein
MRYYLIFSKSLKVKLLFISPVRGTINPISSYCVPCILLPLPLVDSQSVSVLPILQLSAHVFFYDYPLPRESCFAIKI